jgi:hypothetical protein
LSNQKVTIQHLAFDCLSAWKVDGLTTNNQIVKPLIAAKNLRIQIQKLVLPERGRAVVVNAISRVFFAKILNAENDVKKKVRERERERWRAF